jgi:hypothetical protein
MAHYFRVKVGFLFLKNVNLNLTPKKDLLHGDRLALFYWLDHCHLLLIIAISYFWLLVLLVLLVALLYMLRTLNKINYEKIRLLTSFAELYY